MRHLTLACAILLVACAGSVEVGSPAAVHSGSPTEKSEAPVVPPVTCTVGDSKAALGDLSERPASAIVAQGTGIDAYKLEAGVWLPQAPVLINEDFDFATAMTMNGIGAGIAAAKRKSNNEARAQEYAALVLPEEARVRLEELRACGIHRWGLLWNGTTPKFVVVTDSYDENGKLVDSKTTEHEASAVGTSEAWLRD